MIKFRPLICVVLVLFLANLADSKKGPKITNKVFFDVEIDGEKAGRITMGLYGATVPKTVENFRALCTGEKGMGKKGKPLHFKDSGFHRVIPGFMLQGGDFSHHNGTGGESIYGDKFDDENFQVKHSKGGLLSMANAGKNTNGSQFFITCSSTPHLNGKHVVFGRVLEGLPLIRRIENLPCSPSNKPNSDVRVARCGDLGVMQKIQKKIMEDFLKEKSVAEEQSDSDLDDEEEPTTSSQAGVTYGAKDPGQMSVREKKLFALRMQLNLARKQNKKEVANEHKRFNESTEEQGRRIRTEKGKKRAREAEESEIRADMPELNETAEQAEMQYSKRKKKGAAFGWDVFNQDTLYGAYNKRVGSIKKVGIVSDAGKLVSADALDAASHQDKPEDVDRMVAELAKTQERRAKFSRRRKFYDDKDISYINKRNRIFNEKVSRAFDKYTQEIRGNLERGTAL
eukprot:839472_1